MFEGAITIFSMGDLATSSMEAVPSQDLVDIRNIGPRFQAVVHGQMGLRVQVDQDHGFSGPGQGAAQVHGGGRFPTPPF